jgi:hypothetical protein
MISSFLVDKRHQTNQPNNQKKKKKQIDQQMTENSVLPRQTNVQM